MQNWHHTRVTDLTLRVSGAGLCGASYMALSWLAHMRVAAAPGLAAFALAAFGFACASVGAALVTMGHHTFDEIEVSSRWRAAPAPELTYEQLAGSVARSNDTGDRQVQAGGDPQRESAWADRARLHA